MHRHDFIDDRLPAIRLTPNRIAAAPIPEALAVRQSFMATGLVMSAVMVFSCRRQTATFGRHRVHVNAIYDPGKVCETCPVPRVLLSLSHAPD